MQNSDTVGSAKIQTSLEKAFAARKESFTNRASAIFPVRLRAQTDFIIVFLNYWKLKNKISSVACTLRVYNAAGSLVARHTVTELQDHNEFSLREICGADDLDGMVEFEVMSAQNLRFAFPGIMGFYRSGNAFSCVHSAGRVRNSDEPEVIRFSEETNWTCKFQPGIVPFFHVFNGPRAGGVGIITARLLSGDGRELAKRDFDPELKNPFASRVVTLDEIFDLSKVPAGSFATVKVPDTEFFPRLVVGNFHREPELLETTHSFPITTINDYVRAPEKENTLLSFLPIFQPRELEVELVSFPTNAPSHVTGHIRRAPEGESLREPAETISWQTGGEGASVFIFKPKPEDALVSIDFKEGQIPSRLNSSYRYRVRGGNLPFSTDIATSAKSWVYPPKHTHWGQGVLSKEFETILMVRNLSHAVSGGSANTGHLNLYLKDGTVLTKDISLPPASCRFVYLREFAGASAWEKPAFVSWLLNMDNPDVETFWVSFTPDGRICGEHGF